MSQTAIVVEDGVIQCEHGGKVVLKSSEAVHVIGGKKPLHDIDLMGAPIQGCPYYAPVGGNCTSVASITSAVTEENVSAGGLKYLLRVDGCKTDKGAALVLVDPGQTSSTVPSKSGGSAGSITQKELEDAQLDTKENIKKEKYRIHPLRKSNGKIRALRGARDFKVHKNFHFSNDYTHEKVITKTDAYLYVTHDEKTTEYKVVNRGDTSNPVIQKVQFKDTETKILRKHIPFYKEEGTIEILYSNVKLSKEDQAKFTPVSLTIGDKKVPHVKHPKNYSKGVQHEEKEMKKIFISKKEAKALDKAYFNLVLELDDPIGEVEDLYNEMESSFYRAYAHNKGFIDKVKERNAYAYSVAHFMDELELNSQEKKNRETTKKKLKEAYYTLVDGIKDEYLPHIINTCKTQNHTWSVKGSKALLVRMNAFVEHDVAMSYLQQMKASASFLLFPIHVPVTRRERHRYEYHNTFDGERLEFMKEACIREKSSGDYLCLGKMAFNYNVDTQTIEPVQASNYQDEKENHAHIMALLVSSLYFSGKHDDVVGTKYKDAIEAFHYNLKQISAHPEFDEDIQEEINKKFKDSAYSKLFQDKNGKRSDNFIEDYENLETLAKDCAFEWEGNDKTQLIKLANLIPKGEAFDFYFKRKTTTPKQYSQKLNEKLKTSNLKILLQKYAEILKDSKDKEEVLTALNIGYMLSSSRTMYDKEANDISPFNQNSAVMDFLVFISQTLQGIDASQHEALYKEETFQLYHKSLHALILHALVKGSQNEKGFSTRQNNARKNFLDVLAPETAKKFQLDLRDLNDANIDKDLQVKKATEKLFEQLKAIDGITSQIHSAEDAQRKKEKKNKPGSKKVNETVIIKQLRNSAPYKIAIPSLKGLSFLIALYQTGKLAKDYQKLTLSSLLELSASINTMAKITGDAAKGSKLLSAQSRAYSIFTAMKEEKLLFQRVLTKLAIPIVVFGAYHEIASLDDKDYDAMVAISVKMGLTIALMLFATGIGQILIIGIAIEFIWMQLSGYFIDSPMEVMLEKSLFHQTERKSYLLESLSSDNTKYLYKGNEKSINDITLTQKPKDVRDFIYANYNEHKKELNAAFSYEISSIYATLKGVKIETSTIPKHYKSSNANYSVCSYVSISKEFYKEIQRIVLLEDDQEIEIDISKHQLHKDKELIDILSHLVISDSLMMKEYSTKETRLLLHSDTISLKYDVVYIYDDASEYTNRAQGGALKIIDLKSLPLSADDCKILNIQAS